MESNLLILIWRRLWQAVPTVLGVITATFILFHVLPGDPVDILLGDQSTSADRAALRAELGLDVNLLTQFTNFLLHLSEGDLGRSFTNKRAVTHLLAERLPATIELGGTAFLLSALLGICFGVLSMRLTFTPLIRGLEMFASLGYSTPGVFIGPALVWVFALKLGLLPVSERGDLQHLILPSLSLAIPMSCYLFRMTRVAMQEQLRQDYVRTAQAKGLPERQIFFLHILRNALTPVITTLGLQAGAVLTGTVVTETVFDWPGLGTLLYQAIGSRDLPVVEGCVLLIAFIYIFVTLITDLAYAAANPYLRAQT